MGMTPDQIEAATVALRGISGLLEGKHLPGQHNQQDHGRRGPSFDTFAGMAKKLSKLARSNEYMEGPDLALQAMAKLSGHDAKPKIVSREQMDALKKNGSTMWYRGMPNKAHAKQLRSGKYWAGKGYSGNGTYATTVLSTARSYAHFGSLVRMTTAPGANVIPYSELRRQQKSWRSNWGKRHLKAHKAKDSAALDALNDEYATFVDLGRFAEAKGIDGFTRSGDVYSESGKILVMLNRGALIVEATDVDR